MADRPSGRGERKFGGGGGRGGDEPPRRPPIVPPAVAPAVPPVAKPFVPPAVPPTVPPVMAPSVPPAVPPAVPPVMPPVTPPIARPIVPPTMAPVVKPIAPPTMAPVVKPIAPPPPPVAAPVMRPVAPAAAPTVKPVASGSATKGAASSRGRDKDKGDRDDDSGSRGRGSRNAPPPKAGMGGGAKVGLAVLFAALLVLLVTVLPSMKGGTATDDRADFETMGSNAARAFAAALAKDAPAAASGTGVNKKTVDSFVKSVDEQLKALNVRSEGRGTLTATVNVAMALASDPSGQSAKAPLDSLIFALVDRIKASKDDDEKKMLIDEKNRLAEIYQGLGSAAPAPTASGKAKVAAPTMAGTSPVRAIWVTNPKGEVIGESSAGLALPTKPAAASGAYSATVNGVATTIFYAQLNPVQPIAFLAFDDPPAKEGGGSSKLGLLMLILGPLLLGGIAFASANAQAKPIKDLARELDRLGSAGDPTRRINAHGAEASSVARSVERMVSNLKFRDQHAMQDLGEVVSKEQELAGQIHHGLMPKDPPKLAGYEVETLFKPGFEIGGDHFDYFRIDDTHLGVILMDTSVRGIPAALVMAMARAYVRAEAPGVLSPAEVLMKVNRLLAADLSQGQYVTALYAVIDTSTGTAKVASAGHLPLVVYRHAIGKTAVVNPQGVALGLDVGPVFDREITEVEVEIGVGDRLVLHTDGALKVQNETGDEYGEARLYASIKQEAPKNSQAFVNFLGAAIDQFHLTTPQNDDITILTVKRLK